MASRVNTRFLIILAVLSVALVAVVGGLWFVKSRTDVTRSLEKGDQFMAEGDYLKARSYYARALGRDPGNLAYLEKVRRALLSHTPDTADTAREMYQNYISVLRHAAEHHPTDTEQHLPLLEELHQAARRSLSWAYSELLKESADEMLSRATKSHPDYAKGKLYRGIAQVSPWMIDRLSENEVTAGETDIEEFLEVLPESDLGWSSLILARTAALDRLRTAGQEVRATEKERQLQETIDLARTHVKDGPLFLTSVVLVEVSQQQHDPSKISAETLRADLNNLARVIATTEDPTTVSDAALAVERVYWEQERPVPAEMLTSYLETHPDAHGVRLLRATLLYYSNELDASDADSDLLVATDLMPVGFLSQLQFEIKKRALSLKVDTAVRRWDMEGQGGGRGEELLAAIEKAHDELEKVIVDVEGDPLLIRARGQIAFVKRDYGLAAALFNRLVSEGIGVDYRTRLYAALSLESQGELGAALEMLSQANADQPGNTVAMFHEGQLLLRMGQFEQATAMANTILKIDSESEDAERLLLEIARQSDPRGRKSLDPVREAMAAATTAFRMGEYDVARSTLQAELDKAPDDLSLLNGMVRVEIASGRMDEARQFVDQALAVSPKSRTFLTYKANMENPDRIEAIKQYMIDLYSDETERAVETLLALSALRMRYDRDLAEAQTAGDTEKIETLTADIARINSEEIGFRAKAEQLAPENPRLIEYRFMKSVQAKDWPAVEKVIALAERLNVDQAGGALYRGRYEAALDHPEGALQMFQLATERIPYSAMAWRMLALSQRFLGNFQEALNAFERSYANNPNDITTVSEYGKLLSLTGNMTRALIVIRQARRIAPTSPEIRELWLALEAEAGEPAVVLLERRRRYDANPEDKQNGAALADFLGKTKPTRELLLDDDGEERYTYDRWTRLPGVGRGSQKDLIEQEQRKWWAEADEITEALAAEGERRLEWHLLRSGLLRARGDIEGGEDVLRAWAAKQTDPEYKVDAIVALGLYQSDVERKAEAIASFQQALEFESESSHKPHLALGQLYFTLGRYEESIPHFEAVLEKTPARNLELQIVEAYIKTDQLAMARERLAAADAREAPDGTSIMLQASLIESEADALWKDGDREQAEKLYGEHVEALELAIKAEPTKPMPHVLKAVAQFKAARRSSNPVLLDDALITLTRADEVQPDFVQTGLTRVQILRAKEDTTGAINELTRVLERSPGLNDARRLLVQFLLQERRDEAAIEVVKEAVELNPSTVFWVVALGDLYISEQRKTERELRALPPNSRSGRTLRTEIKRLSDLASQHYETALALSPVPRLVSKRADILLGNDPPDYKGAIKLIEDHAGLVEDSPTLRTLYARSLAATGKLDPALEHMQIAYTRFRELIGEERMEASSIGRWYQELFRIYGAEKASQAEAFARKIAETPDSYELRALANIWNMRGPEGLSRAIELRTKAIELAPADDQQHLIGLHRDLGGAFVLTRQHREALVAYQKALELDPLDGPTLNNVAYIYSEFLAEPQKALPFAQRAAERLPADGSIMDTLGFVYFRMGNMELAESYLRRASQLAPSAENQMHMGALFHKKGDYPLAMRYLAKAAELNPSPEIRAEINRLADDIRTKTGDRQ